MEKPPVAEPPIRQPDGGRRAEILDTASDVFASSGYVGTTLKDVADACGILPGSLYHHFESKESIAVELLERYQTELDAIGRSALDELDQSDADTAFTRITTYAVAIAGCAIRHRAAVQLSLYEPHTGAGQELVTLARRQPVNIHTGMQKLLDEARQTGYFKARIDLSILSEQLCQTMLHTGMSVLHRESSAHQVATTLCRLLLEGLSTRPYTDPELDRSAAMRAAERAVVVTWSEQEGAEPNDRLALIRSVARVEFARRGYEATTVRDIASAAGMGTGSVYRFVESKNALLDSIMGSFHAKLSSAYGSVITSDSTPIEKLDALTWINLNAVERFDREFQIQRAWLRQRPPDTSAVFSALKKRARQIRDVIDEGQHSGEIRLEGVSIDRLTSCVRDLIWVPPPVVERVGKHTALAHSRETLIRGAVSRRAA
ncbi:TetR/AcrR family transcriptional regulator [Streptomyces sp. NPDC002577]